MEYRQKEPMTKRRREIRREGVRVRKAQQEERNRQRSQGGGQPNELGVVEGQNGEQGNSVEPRNTKPIGKTES